MLSRPDAILGQVVWFTKKYFLFFLRKSLESKFVLAYHDQGPSLGQ